MVKSMAMENSIAKKKDGHIRVNSKKMERMAMEFGFIQMEQNTKVSG